MRLRADQLNAQLQRELLPTYIISGDETLLVQECCDAVRARCREQGFAEREVLHVESGFDWQQLLASAQSLSLFAERKLLELRLPTGKPGDAGSKAIQAYLQSPNPDTVVLIICNKLDGNTTRGKWYKAIEKAGAAVQVWPVSYRELPRWIDQRLQRAGLKASRDAIQLLAERSQGNLLACAQEIDKLQLAGVEQTVDVDTITRAVADNARFDVFDLVDTALGGDAGHALRTLQGLRGEGTEAPIVLWALSREIRTLYQCAWHLQRGAGIERVLQNAKVWDRRKNLVKTALRRLDHEQLAAMLQQARQADCSIKGLNKADTWNLLAQLTLALAGKAPAAALSA